MTMRDQAVHQSYRRRGGAKKCQSSGRAAFLERAKATHVILRALRLNDVFSEGAYSGSLGADLAPLIIVV